MKQYLITPAAGKRLIAKAICQHPRVKETLNEGTMAIIAGTTNGYVAEEILGLIGEDFSRNGFYRGIVIPPGKPQNNMGQMSDIKSFPGDMIIRNGKFIAGKTIFEVVDDLKEGDLIFKGANTLNYQKKQAAIYIGHPQGGTIGTSLQAVVGRRVQLIIPVGLEKRVHTDLNQMAVKLNQPGHRGPRLLPVPGEIFTEIEAIKLLTGASAELVAAGGVDGAEGSIWIAIDGNSTESESAREYIKSVANEPNFSF